MSLALGAMSILLLCYPPESAGAEPTMQLRIAWGGGRDRRWEGTISLKGNGAVSQPRPLGIEADEPGSMWLEQGELVIRQRSTRAYDGVDLTVKAPWEAALWVQLVAADKPDQPIQIEIPLADLATGFFDRNLDLHGNRILVRRTPGDQLRVRTEKDQLVFSAGETFRCSVEPNLLAADAGNKVRVKMEFTPSGNSQQLWSGQCEVATDRRTTIPVEITLPEQEGVYELTIVATHPANWQEAVRKPLKWKETLAERKVQLLVLSDKALPAGRTSRELKLVGGEIDPTSPNWQDRLSKLPTLTKLPRLWKGPLDNGQVKYVNSPLGQLVQLGPSSQSPDWSWEAYQLPVAQPGLPHVLEVEYPSHVPQTLGISVLEPNAAGALMPIGLDSGIDTDDPRGAADAPQWLRHRLVFWPRTTSPLVLMSNHRRNAPAVFGKLRVLAGWNHLPRAVDLPSGQQGRLVAAYLDRPLFPENFSAHESLDAGIGRGVDDWRTFYEGGTRLAEYLQYAGHNALMISVLADGSTIYPSAVLEPTPRYDTGVFLSSGQDPLRKDVLEMLFRVFDREGLQLIPAIEFASPLPSLEAMHRRGDPDAETIEWVGPEGTTWRQTHLPYRGLAPYYNVLQPAVQEAMLDVVREIASRYAHHASFAGLAIQLSAHGYAQLLGPEWGLDDATFARFQRDTKLQVPGTGPQRFQQRAAFVAGSQQRAWLEWRAAELAKFYHRMQRELAAARPGSRLYLAGNRLLDHAEIQAHLRPALPRHSTLGKALLQAGIDVQHYQDQAEPVLLRPERMAPGAQLSDQAVSLETSQMPDIDEYFRGLATPGSLFFHPPQEARLPSFDQRSPFRPSFTQLYTQPVPSGQQNRRRFVHSLATLDSQVLVDGGWTLPLGQEDSTRDVVAAFRHLPPIRFQGVGNPQEASAAQPVTFRYGKHAEQTYLYAVNDAPFATTAWIRVQASPDCRFEEVTGFRQVSPLKRDSEGAFWMVELRPYDLVAVRLSDPNAKFSQVRVPLPATVEKALEQRIRELAARAAALRNMPPPLKSLSNAGFEQPAVAEEMIPGWYPTQRPDAKIRLDKTQKHGGLQSVRLTTNGPWASLASQPFGAPATGRIAVSVFLRVADANQQPCLHIGLSGQLDGERYDHPKCAQVGKVAGASDSAWAAGNGWTWYLFPFDDLPLEGLSQLQLRFDLMGPGEVWIDDIELFDLHFDKRELIELSKLVSVAQVTLQNGQVGDCLRLMDGYWPRFLEEHVPLDATAMAARPPARSPPQPAEPSRERTGLMDRMKGLLPRQLKF